MADPHKEWRTDGLANGWHMPPEARWKCLPIIRHIRAAVAALAVDEHETFWRTAGLIPTGYDQWVLYGIWHGLSRATPHREGDND